MKSSTLLERVFGAPKTSLFLMTLVVLGLGHQALFIELDNSPETFFAADREAQLIYRKMVQTFGADEVALFELAGASPGNRADLLTLAQLARAVAQMEGVAGVLSLADSFDDRMTTLPEQLDSRQLAAVQNELERIPLYRSLGLARPEAPALGVMALLVMKGSDARLKFTDAGQSLAARFSRSGIDVQLIGLTPTNAAFDRLTRRSLIFFMPAVVLVSLLIGFAIFRSVPALVALFFPVLGSVALGVAGLSIFGETLNLVTAVLPPLIMVIGFAGAIHIVSHYGSLLRECSDPQTAVRQTIQDKFAPTAFAFITTAIGFGSLSISEVTSIRVLGISAAATLIVTLVLVTFGTPAFLLLLRPQLHAPEHRQLLLERLARFSISHRFLVIIIAAVLVTSCALGLPRVRQSISGLKLLGKQAPVRVAFERLEDAGVGLGNIDLWFHKPLPDFEAIHGELEIFAKLTEELEKIPLVTATLSAKDVVEQAHYRLQQKMGRPMPAFLLGKALGDRLTESLSRFWQKDKGFKLTVLTKTADKEEAFQKQKQAILKAARKVYPSIRIDVSGHYTMLIGTPGSLMKTLGQSLGVTALVITLLLALTLGSPRLALVGMVANIIPVLAVLGLMGWLDIPLDVATVMTASVAFGLAVDDTYHYLYHAQKERTVITAAAIAGQGIVATTMVVAGGFLALGLSGFNPVVRFGMLTAGAGLIALAVDGTLLPALLGRREELAQVQRDLARDLGRPLTGEKGV